MAKLFMIIFMMCASTGKSLRLLTMHGHKAESKEHTLGVNLRMAGPDEGHDLLKKCFDLNALENKADHAISNDNPQKLRAVLDYEQALQTWREQRFTKQPVCRTQFLGMALCEQGRRLQSDEIFVTAIPGSQWYKFMSELATHEQDSDDCEHFAEYYSPRRWNPQVFLWSENGNEHFLDAIVNDLDYMSLYARAGHLAPPYGDPSIPTRTRPQGKLRLKRAANLHYMDVVRKVFSTSLSSFLQVIEFGGGTGDLGATLVDMGYNGTHFMYDYPAMSIMQGYWLRYSGVPAYFGTNIPKNPGAAKGKLVLESSAGQDLQKHIDISEMAETLFFATFSFTEADLESRSKIVPLLEQSGRVLIGWADDQHMKYKVDNRKYLQNLISHHLSRTHNVLVWQMIDYEAHYWLAAIRKDLGNLTCSAKVNCFKQTLHPVVGLF